MGLSVVGRCMGLSGREVYGAICGREVYGAVCGREVYGAVW